EVLNEVHISLNDLSAIAVSKGPGSYTGLRIGVSAAKRLCYALDIPLIAIDTLAVLAEQLAIDFGCIVPMIDARRMEVFTQVFDYKLQPVSNAEALIVEEYSLSELTETSNLIVYVALKRTSVLTAEKFVYHQDIIYPSAKQMGRLSYKSYTENAFEDMAYFELYYLK